MAKQRRLKRQRQNNPGPVTPNQQGGSSSSPDMVVKVVTEKKSFVEQWAPSLLSLIGVGISAVPGYAQIAPSQVASPPVEHSVQKVKPGQTEIIVSDPSSSWAPKKIIVDHSSPNSLEITITEKPSSNIAEAKQDQSDISAVQHGWLINSSLWGERHIIGNIHWDNHSQHYTVRSEDKDFVREQNLLAFGGLAQNPGLLGEEKTEYVLSDGTVIDLWLGGQWISGHIEHKGTTTYYFKADQGGEAVLGEGMRVRLEEVKQP